MRKYYILLILITGIQLFVPFTTSAKWVQTKGLCGIKTYSVAARGLMVFAGTDKGLYRSLDNGENWTKCTSGLPNTCSIYSVAVTDKSIFVVVRSVNSYGGHILFSSNDNGITWLYNQKLPKKTLIVTGKNIVVQGFNGLMYSIDNGNKWNSLNSSTDLIYAVNGLLVANQGNGNISSTNFVAGNTWTPFLKFNGLVSDITSSEGNIFASVNNCIHISKDKGNSWKALLQSDTPINKIAVSGQNIFVATSSGILRSRNLGKDWTKVGSDECSVNNLVVSGSNIFAYSPDFGIARTFGNDSVWVEANKGIYDETYIIDSILVAGSNIFASTTKSDAYDKDRKLFRLSNAGSWDIIKLNVLNEVFRYSDKLIYFGNQLYCNIEHALRADVTLCSDDNGSSWFKSKDGLPNGEFVKITMPSTNDRLIFAATKDHIYSSQDNGIHWYDNSYDLLPKNTKNKYEGKTVVSLIVSDNNVLVSKGLGVFKLLGQKWGTLNEGLAADVKVHKLINSGKEVFALTNQGVYHLMDGEISWESYNAGLPELFSIESLVASDKYLFALTSNGVYSSMNNGIDWFPANNGLPIGIKGKSLAARGSNLYLCTDIGLFKSINNGSNWSQLSLKLPTNDKFKTIGINKSSIYVFTENGSMLRSDDDGNNWSNLIQKESNTWSNTKKNNESLALFDDFLITHKEDKFFRSTNNGRSWALVESNLLAGYNGYIGASSISTCDSILITNTKEKGWFRLGKLGTSWTKINGFEVVDKIQSITSCGKLLYALTSNGVFRSTNYGNDWSPLEIAIENHDMVTSLISLDSNIFIATASGIYYSTNNMNSWNFASNGLPKDYQINDLIVLGKYLYVGTKYGVWKRQL